MRSSPTSSSTFTSVVDLLQNQVIVPEVAVQQGSSGSFVYVVGDDAKVKVENVQVGVVEGNDAQRIYQWGRSRRLRVVTDGTDKLQNGSKVRIRDVNGAGGRAPGHCVGAKKKAPAPKAASPAAGTPEGAPKTPKTLSTTPPSTADQQNANQDGKGSKKRTPNQ